MYLFVALNTQGVVLWQGSNLIIYAAKWEGSLARKLKRIGSHRREVDISDAIEILAHMVNEHGGPLTWGAIESRDEIMYTPLDNNAITCVAKAYIER